MQLTKPHGAPFPFPLPFPLPFLPFPLPFLPFTPPGAVEGLTVLGFGVWALWVTVGFAANLSLAYTSDSLSAENDASSWCTKDVTVSTLMDITVMLLLLLCRTYH